jgi:hypothetical protein
MQPQVSTGSHSDLLQRDPHDGPLKNFIAKILIRRKQESENKTVGSLHNFSANTSRLLIGVKKNLNWSGPRVRHPWLSQTTPNMIPELYRCTQDCISTRKFADFRERIPFGDTTAIHNNNLPGVVGGRGAFQYLPGPC